MMKIIGAMQVGGYCEWVLPKSLRSLSSIVDEVVLVGSGRVSDEITKMVRETPKISDLFRPRARMERYEQVAEDGPLKRCRLDTLPRF